MPSNAGDISSGEPYLDEKIREWLDWDQNNDTRREIENLVHQQKWDELRRLLMTRLTFGTAGIRGFMRAGYSSMNDLVLIQTSQGLAEYLANTFDDVTTRGVILGYDARYNSKRFAERTAVALLQKDIPVYLYSNIVPTPFIPFGIKLLQCTAGVMVTASHNPKGDNGYKVYFSNGAQITSPHDKGIQAAIDENLKPWPLAWDRELLSKTKDPLDNVKAAYYNSISSNIYDRSIIEKSSSKFTYTSLHGVGHEFLTKALHLIGLENRAFSVPEQREPDPDFPTVTFPNPEEGKGVLDLSIKTAEATGSKIILANDPDADRCAVAEQSIDSSGNSSWRIFKGDEIGALLGWWLWMRAKEQGANPKDTYMISSAVSSKFLQSLAKLEGFNFIETLTGFKWMGNKSDELIKSGKTVLFAYEEAIGYMCGSSVLDKDGISAAVEVAQLACWLEVNKQMTLAQHLTQLYKVYGYHCSLNSYYICHDQQVIKSIFERMTSCESANGYPDSIGPYKIVRVRDLNRGYDSSTPDNKPVLPTSKSSFMLTFYFENGVVLTIRTSGTEPKIKYYTEAIAEPQNSNWDEVDKMIIDLVWRMINQCLEPERNGLKPRPE